MRATRVLARTASALTMTILLISRFPLAVAAKLTVEDAQKLAATATGHAKHTEDLDFQNTMSDAQFFVFYGLNPPPAAAGFGFFAVNRWTGDVWDLWGCHKFSNSALRKAQVAIRHHFARNDQNTYQRLANLKPECIFEN